jgi:hypothetical protein
MKLSTALTAISSGALLFSCAGVPQTIPPIPAQEKVAIVTFDLDKSITAEAEIGKQQEHDAGPGLLQKDSSYYADHQAALDSVWSKFQAALPGALGATIVPVSEVVANPKYLEVTTYAPKKILGQDVSIEKNYLQPKNGLRYITAYDSDTARLHALSEALGVKKLLIVENKADYRMTAGIAGVGSAKTTLHTALSFYEPGKGVYWKGRYEASSKSSCAMLGGTISTSSFPKLIPEAADPILAKIAEDAARGRGETPSK